MMSASSAHLGSPPLEPSSRVVVVVVDRDGDGCAADDFEENHPSSSSSSAPPRPPPTPPPPATPASNPDASTSSRSSSSSNPNPPPPGVLSATRDARWSGVRETASSAPPSDGARPGYSSSSSKSASLSMSSLNVDARGGARAREEEDSSILRPPAIRRWRPSATTRDEGGGANPKPAALARALVVARHSRWVPRADADVDAAVAALVATTKQLIPRARASYRMESRFIGRRGN
mmetsp:Transcript_2963/g.9735  ORF Transcript_2963/g.9735 Transcript_2963/m.9735 type:complete len:234 (+) Transcript_2963:1553-2254(+)